MKPNASTRWHRPAPSARREGDVGAPQIEGEESPEEAFDERRAALIQVEQGER